MYAQNSLFDDGFSLIAYAVPPGISMDTDPVIIWFPIKTFEPVVA